jgi:hypothetical protein
VFSDRLPFDRAETGFSNCDRARTRQRTPAALGLIGSLASCATAQIFKPQSMSITTVLAVSWRMTQAAPASGVAAREIGLRLGNFDQVDRVLLDHPS